MANASGHNLRSNQASVGSPTLCQSSGTSALSNLRDPTCPPTPSRWGGWLLATAQGPYWHPVCTTPNGGRGCGCGLLRDTQARRSGPETSHSPCTGPRTPPELPTALPVRPEAKRKQKQTRRQGHKTALGGASQERASTALRRQELGLGRPTATCRSAPGSRSPP